MKKLLIAFVILLCIKVNAQIPGYTGINSGYDWLRGKFRALHVPAGGTVSLSVGQYSGSGAIMYDSTGADSGFYVWHYPYWVKLAPASSVYGTLQQIFDAESAKAVTNKDDTISIGSNRFVINGNSFFSMSPAAVQINPYLGVLKIDSLNAGAGTKALRWDPATGAVTVADTTTGGSGSGAVSEGLIKRNDTTVIANNRNIYYLNQPTSGSSLPAYMTAVGSPVYTVSNGVFQFGGNGDNNTQYIRFNAGVLSEGSYIEGYVIIDSLNTFSQGPGFIWKSYNSYSGTTYAHDVIARMITGSAASNTGKALIYGKTGNSSNYSDSSRASSAGDTIYFRFDRDGLAYTLRVKNLTKGWKLYKQVQTTPAGSPFVAHNSAYVGFIPGSGGYKLYGWKYVVKAPLYTENYIVGNSIAYRQGATTEGGGWASLVGTPSLNIVSGGGADGTASVLARLHEIKAINPKRVILMIGGNDILFGISSGTWQANYLAIRDSLVSWGIEVVHCLPTPRTATDVSALKNYIDTSSTFRSDIKIDTWTPLWSGSGTSLATKYNLDGTHPNDAGHLQIASTVNTALHYSNGDGQYVAANGYAYNGYYMARTPTTGDANKNGAFIALASGTSKTSYVTMARESGYGVIEARTEGSSYDPVVLSPYGATSVGIRETSPSATLDIKNSTAGTALAMIVNHAGAYSANDQELQFDWQNAHATRGRIATYLHNSSRFGFKFYTYTGSVLNTTPALTLTGDNTIGVLTTAPTARLHLPAGTTAASTGPLKFTSGSLMTSPEAGAVEFLTDKWYATITTGTARKEVTLNDAALTSGVTPVATTNGRLTDGLTLASSTYTPTITTVSNVDVATPSVFGYDRVGNSVRVWGEIDIDPTVISTATEIGISLPVASAFTLRSQLGGSGVGDNVTLSGATLSSSVYADATNDRASFRFTSLGTGVVTVTFHFSYTIL